jgi:site-specific recombinase XerD
MPEAWQQSWESFELKVRSDETGRVYRTSMADFGQHLIAVKGSAPELGAVTRDDVRRYLRDLDKAGKAPATQHMRFRSLRTIFGWLAKEHDIEASPVDGVDAPKLDKPKTTVLKPDEIKALLGTCRARTSTNAAIRRCFGYSSRDLAAARSCRCSSARII